MKNGSYSLCIWIHGYTWKDQQFGNISTTIEFLSSREAKNSKIDFNEIFFNSPFNPSRIYLRVIQRCVMSSSSSVDWILNNRRNHQKYPSWYERLNWASRSYVFQNQKKFLNSSCHLYCMIITCLRSRFKLFIIYIYIYICSKTKPSFWRTSHDYFYWMFIIDIV